MTVLVQELLTFSRLSALSAVATYLVETCLRFEVRAEIAANLLEQLSTATVGVQVGALREAVDEIETRPALARRKQLLDRSDR